MSYRFALRWTAIGLVCALAILVAAFALKAMCPAPVPITQQVSFDALVAAEEMPLDANGTGTQIISGTILSLKLQPYPPRASVPVTLTLIAISPNGRNSTTVTPTLMIQSDNQPGIKEYALALQPDRTYTYHGVLFPDPGAWHLRLDVYVGDEIPANMLLTVKAN
jgi:hypothetical protein